MKQIITWIDPEKKFTGEAEKLIKIQIENSLELGWKVEDIILITNYKFEYKGVRALAVRDENYCSFCIKNTKMNVIVALYRIGLITPNNLYWLHDLDVFQSEPLIEPDMEGKDMALTDYGRMQKFNMGSIFFKASALNIFIKIWKEFNKDKLLDEVALVRLLNRQPDLYKRIKKLNISYNFQPFNIKSCYGLAIKPIQVVHFHPDTVVRQVGMNTLDLFLRGKNKVKKVLVSERLLKIFNKYGYS
jgi:hypothetical protein